MKPGHGKQKGSKFEREICTKLSRWWTAGKRDDVFWRSTSSGARATQRSKSNSRTHGQYGDITATDPIGEPLMDLVTIELKVGYSPHSIADVFDAPDTRQTEPKFLEWIRQAYSSWSESGASSWWLITKRDRRDTMLYMPLHLYKELCPEGQPVLTFLVRFEDESIWVAGCRLDMFLIFNGAKRIIAVGKRL